MIEDEVDPPTCPICDHVKLSERCSSCGYTCPVAPASEAEYQACMESIEAACQPLD